MAASEGGHDVPEEKILSRIPRTVENIKKALLIADYADIYENSSDTQSHSLQASIENGRISHVTAPSPVWLREILSEVLINEAKPLLIPTTKTMHKENLLSPLSAKLCKECGGYLRGSRRVSYGICSKCDPKYGKK